MGTQIIGFLMYNRFNFHKHTFCLFKQVDATTIVGEIPHYKSASGSEYFFTEQGVYRKSNHWGRAANCRWRLETQAAYKNQSTVVGYANWIDFYPNNETEKWFYIDVDWVANQAFFFHKNDPNYRGQLLRNANETAKRIQKINEVLQQDHWKKYTQVYDEDVALQRIVAYLITTNETLFQIIQKVNGTT